MNPFLPILLLFLLTGSPAGTISITHPQQSRLLSSKALGTDTIALQVVFRSADQQTDTDQSHSISFLTPTFRKIERSENRLLQEGFKTHVRFRDGPAV